jgi:hypothetical protein
LSEIKMWEIQLARKDLSDENKQLSEEKKAPKN